MSSQDWSVLQWNPSLKILVLPEMIITWGKLVDGLEKVFLYNVFLNKTRNHEQFAQYSHYIQTAK